MSLTFIIVFFAIIILINLKNIGVKDYQDFATSKGSFGMLAVSLAVFASWYTGSIFTAWSDFNVGLGFIGMYVMIYTSLMLALMYSISEKVYLWGKKYRLSTLGELMDLRYRSKTLRLLTGLTGIVFVSPWLILEWIAIGVVIHYATAGAVSLFWGMLIGMLVVLVYVVTGGMRSVITAQVFQGSYMFFIGVGVMFYLIYYNFGSLDGAMTLLSEKFPDALTFPGPGWDPPYTYWTSLVITSGIGALVLPYVFNKLLVADSVRSVKKGLILAPIMAVIFWAAFSFLGMGAHTFDFARNNPYEAYMWIAQLTGPIPMALMSVLIVAASISSTAAIIQSISSLITTDVSLVINRKITDKQSIFISRVAVVVISITTMYVATLGQEQLIFLALYTYQAVVLLFPVTLLGLFWKRANKVGAIISIVLGLSVSLYISLAEPAFLADFGWQGGIYGMLVAFTIIIIDGFLRPVDSHVEKLWKDIEMAKERPHLRKDQKEDVV
ncbi:Na+/proline symporter [Alteribacillus persepolensis]|uniref:Na+/proline symporter n=1 Tax=Alteribacillus persepolensis TaxID=568899 RepID=A0A1G8JLE3_9BACI|nr:sodium:solute symporter family protein [Alteribacillus persepolensis]SDI31891.1 Na+/proline symporter [Alteribacillus persepolensis]